ncbi:sugar ABC transporter permease [Shinella sp.]|uniref:carbohydrate ABC transporter permease n=1 Tax=Shinella sp. TaxID=1870904 RepID=UPI00258FEFEF|nr:sugar ABC transporter permease [Shinella sp.]MCW5706900.1 sugar ABC transporter permease [Shinella sp.]
MLWKRGTGLVVLFPAVAWILCFTLFPLVYAAWVSLQSMRMGGPSRFVWFQNYYRILTDGRVYDVLLTSMFLSIFGVLLTLVLGVGMAWLFSREIRGIRVLRTLLTMPLFTAPVAIAFASIALFNETDGPINNILLGLGFSQPVLWLSNPYLAKITVLLVDSWQWTPFVFIIVLAAMQGIPEDLYEAARIETKSELAIFRRVTLPLIMPALSTVAILRLVETFKILDVPINLTAGGPGSATQTYSYYTYVVGLKNFNLGYGAALSWALVLVCAVLASIFFSLNKKRYEEV